MPLSLPAELYSVIKSVKCRASSTFNVILSLKDIHYPLYNELDCLMLLVVLFKFVYIINLLFWSSTLQIYFGAAYLNDRGLCC